MRSIIDALRQDRGLAGLAGVTAIALVGAVVVLATRTGPQEVPPGARMFPSLVAQDTLPGITNVTVRTKDETVELKLVDGVWRVASKHGFPADRTAIHKLVVDMAQAAKVEAKTRKPELFDRLNLVAFSDKADSAATQVTLAGDDGTAIADLLIGKERRGGVGGGQDAFYVRIPGDSSNQTWLAAGSLEVDDSWLDYVDRDLANLPKRRVKRAVLTRMDGGVLTVRKDKPEDEDFVIVGLPEDAKIGRQFRVNNVAGGLELLEFDDVRPAEGITIPEETGSAVFETWEGLTYKVTMVPIDDDIWVKFDVTFEAPEDGVPMREDDTPLYLSAEDAEKEGNKIAKATEGWLFKLSVVRMERFATSLNDLVNREES